ncbi:MAG: Sec7 domain-containing protein [Candidatus Berkiella sp.]
MIGSKEFIEAEFLKRFHNHHKDGMAYLQANTTMGQCPVKQAQLLNQLRDKLAYDTLGQCLTHKDNQALLKAYIDKMDFRGMSFTDALRKVLTDFKFEGEAQIIDRIMENFGTKFYQDNCKQQGFEFKSKDACVILAYSTVMLNTDLHNKQNRNKMTVESFIRNNRGMNKDDSNQESDFDKAFLTSIYTQIKRNEIKINQEATQASNYDDWCAGKGGYRFGYLTSYYVFGCKPATTTIVKQQNKADSLQENKLVL